MDMADFFAKFGFVSLRQFITPKTVGDFAVDVNELLQPIQEMKTIW